MANGPLGGMMPTPPAPSQPPQVSLDTSVESRNNFKNFLGTLPKTDMFSPSGMGVGLSTPAPMTSLADNVNIFAPVGMHQGGVAGNPLDSYGDFLSNQINNTQVEPFIQEIQQMASQRFNLDNSGGLKTFLEPTIFEPPQDLSRPKMEVAEPLLQPFNPIMQRPVAPFQMQGLGQPMRDKDGILRQSIFQEPVKREPMGLRGGPNPDMIRTLDQQIFNDGFMPGSEQLLGGLPRTFDDGGEVQNFFSGGEIDSFVDDQDSGNNFSGGNNNDDDDGFSFDDDVSDYQTDDSGVYTGGDDQSIALPTPRPQILLDAVGRAENEIFGGTESDALGFFNKSGGLSN
jgi:hypothetical protein